MAERIREVTVTIEVDTNKQTLQEKLTWDDSETFAEFEQRVTQALSNLTEIS